MGFLCGKTCECKKQCSSWAAGMPDVVSACKDACKVDNGLNKDQFFCSGNYLNQSQFILQYGFDPCPGDGVTFENTVVDPGGYQSEANSEQWAKIGPVLAVLALFIGLALFTFLKSRR
jgi:hypothetical protein